MPTSCAPYQLGLAEAVELGHAWCHQLAQQSGIRALLIKGPSLERQGLRDSRVSADIDILVEPSRFDDFVVDAQAAGWRERSTTYLSQRTTKHSRTFTHAEWPCDLDIHRSFPGFLVDSPTLFEALWGRRCQMSFAHHACWVPDRLSSILILALHSQRGTDEQSRHRRELNQLLSVARLNDDERGELTEVARATGSTGTLGHFLASLGVDLTIAEIELPSPELLRWRARVQSGSSGSYFWIDLIERAESFREVAEIVQHAVWPSAEDLMLTHPDLANTVEARLFARVARLSRWASASLRVGRALMNQWFRNRPLDDYLSG